MKPDWIMGVLTFVNARFQSFRRLNAQKNSFPAMKLGTTLGIHLFIACACIFVGIMAVIESSIGKSESEQAHYMTGLLQAEMAQRVELNLSFVARSVDRSAHAVKSLRHDLNRENIAEILKLMIQSNPEIIGGALAYVPGYAPDGQRQWMLYVNRHDAEIRTRQLDQASYDYTSMPWFAIPARDGRAGWSAPYFDKGAGDCLMTTFSQPVQTAAGRTEAIITADVELGTLINDLSRLRPYPSSLSFLIDMEGHLVGTPELYQGFGTLQKQLLNAIDLHVDGGRYADEDMEAGGRNYLVCYAPLDCLNLIVCTATPYDVIYSSFRRIKLPLLSVVSAAFILLLFGIHFVLRYALRPLNELSRAAVEIGNGNFDTKLPEINRYADIVQLKDAMCYMEKSIRGYIVEIDKNARESERVQSELDIASGIQRNMLPDPDCAGANFEGMEVAAILESAREVSGDLYDYLFRNGNLYFIIADVSGKGVPAALVMARVHSLFRFAAEQDMDPSLMLAKINRFLCDNNKNCMFVTAIIGKTDMANNTLILANAGHNPPLLQEKGQFRYLKLLSALPLGVMDDTVFNDLPVAFRAGQKLVLYTDGLTEAEDARGRQYGENRLLACLEKAALGHPAQIVDSIREDVGKFAASPLADDITIFCAGIFGRELCLRYDLREIARLSDWIEAIAGEQGWSDAFKKKVQLVAEECAANIIRYSPPARKEDTVDILIIPMSSEVHMEISDSGAQFDPLAQAPEVDITESAEERGVGGLGIFLIRRLSEHISYQYDGRNRLCIELQKE